MYTIFRMSIFLILFIICILGYKKIKGSVKKGVVIIIAIIIMILASLSYLVPIENLWRTFASPEDVFHYKYTGTIIDIIDGKETSMILSYHHNSYSYILTPKEENGWKIGNELSQVNVITKHAQSKTICLYQYKNTNDFYLVILDLPSAEKETINISDNLNSEFKHYEQRDNKNMIISRIYYTYLDNFDERYVLNIDNTNITF